VSKITVFQPFFSIPALALTHALYILSAKKSSKKSKVKVTLYQRPPRLPASPPLTTSQFQSLVVSLSDRNVFSCCIYTTCSTYSIKLFI